MAKILSPEQALRLAKEQNALFVDVRETEEYADVRMPGAVLQPLSVLQYLPADDNLERPAVYFCYSGRRTGGAMEKLDSRGHAETYIIDGGLEAWQKAGLPTEKSRNVLPIIRQVHIAAGALIVIFLLIGQKVPFFRLFAVFIGLGLLTSGLTGACGLAMLMKKMPWNKKG